jgi:hypothetical protein
MQGFKPMPGSDFQNYLQIANRLRQLSDDVDEFCTNHMDALTEEQVDECDHASQALEDAFHVLIGADLDARLEAAKPDLDRLKEITAETQTALRRVKEIDAGVKIALALGGVALGIAERDPAAIKDSIGNLVAAIQPLASTKPANGGNSGSGTNSQG